MEKMDKEKQRIISKMVDRANKEMNELTDVERVALTGFIYSLMEPIKFMADGMGISRDVMLLFFFNSIMQNLFSESETNGEDKKPKPTVTLYRPPKGGGYIQ